MLYLMWDKAAFGLGIKAEKLEIIGDMKKFTCECIKEQFKNTDEVYVDFAEQSHAEILCIYRPKDKVTLRRIRLSPNFCPECGKPLEDYR